MTPTQLFQLIASALGIELYGRINSPSYLHFKCGEKIHAKAIYLILESFLRSVVMQNVGGVWYIVYVSNNDQPILI